MAKNKTVNKFKTAVEDTPDVRNCYQPGLRALGGHSIKIQVSNTSLCSGSVDIDDCTKTKYPQANRWDYAIGYNDKAYFVEVHSAKTSEVGTVIKKFQWLKDWLNNQAPELNKIKASKPYYWIQSNGYDIPASSRQAKEAASAGIKPISKLVLGE